MCGIIGGWWSKPPAGLEDRLLGALAAVSHRGPDDRGLSMHRGAEGTVALGHARLSIIDLSSGGHQPMQSADGRHTLVFNGEIYNYRELRRELSNLGVIFVSDSDTEVLLAAWRTWGSACLPRLIGMFSFVVHDRLAETLTCVRDAFGIKPLFYGHQRGRFVFGSELPALSVLTGERRVLDWQRAYDYLVFGDYDSGPRSFVAGILHLPPGHVVELDCQTGVLTAPQCWWRPATEQHRLSFAAAAERLRELFLDSVRLHLRSDVPLGATLSGGLDSSAVVCAMRHLERDLPIHTFSYVARNSPVDEEPWADCINSHVGAAAHKVTVAATDLAGDLDALIRCQGEPFMSTSIYAQYCVFREARDRGITVTLDGQGADETLAGYSGYPGPRTLSLLERGNLVGALAFTWRWSKWPGRQFSEPWRHVLARGLPAVLRHRTAPRAKTEWLDHDLLAEAGIASVPEGRTTRTAASGRRLAAALHGALTSKNLPALLRHGDRNSMRFSIESRVPFLTLPLAEFLLTQPEEYLVSPAGETKSLFRAAMRGIVPDAVLDRRDKIGFRTPEPEWLRLLAPQVKEWLAAPIDVPFLRRDRLETAFDEMASGHAAWTPLAWRFINFTRWAHMFDVAAGTPETGTVPVAAPV